MQRFGKWLGRLLLALAGFVVLLWTFGPREPVDMPEFDHEWALAEVDAKLAAQEARFTDITPGTEARVIWAGDPGTKTDYSVVYLHGFSATSEEIRPVPDNIAAALGANLHYARLAGHGRGAAAMAEPAARDWLFDASQALEIGRTIGDKVIVITTSTGGTLAAVLAREPDRIAGVHGIVFVSPNFGLNHPAASVLTWPMVRDWGPWVFGRDRSFDPANEAHATYFTTAYPSVSALPMTALVKHANGLDYGDVTTPALFYFTQEDQVVDPARTQAILERWGGAVSVDNSAAGVADDTYRHVIAGDILSPSNTAPATAAILAWINEL